MKQTQSDIFTAMVEKWPSTLVASSEVKTFSGGIVSGKTLANLRSLGEPVPESIKIGSKRALIAVSLADWLRQRTEGGQAA